MTILGVKEVEVQTIRSFHIKLDPAYTNGHDFCELIVDEKNNTFTARLNGEIYTDGWGNPGKSFVSFLIKTFREDEDYLFRRLEDMSKKDYINEMETAVELKKKALQARRYLQLSEEQAREIWEEIESFEGRDGITQNHLYSEWHSWFEQTIASEIVSDEPWFEEFIVYNEDWKCRVFCAKVAPILANVMEQEYGLT